MSSSLTMSNSKQREAPFGAIPNYSLGNIVGSTQKNLNESRSSTYSETGHETGTIITDNMDPTTRAAYNALLTQLQGGGSASQRTATAALASLLSGAQAGVDQWSQDAARQQAQRSTAQYTQQLRETILPQLNAAMEAAGMSGDSLNALLAQDAAARTATSAAAAEGQLITQYGALARGQQDVAATVAAQMQEDPVMQMLANAINIGKGSLTTETRNLTTTKSGTKSDTGTSTEAGSTSSTSSNAGFGSSGSGIGSGGDLASLLSGLAGNRSSIQAGTNSSDAIQQAQGLALLQSLMPNGQNILAGNAYNNAPVRGIPSAFNSNQSESGTTTRYGGISNLLQALGLN